MFGIHHESYGDYTKNTGTLIKESKYYANKHFHYSFGLEITQSLLGGVTSTFDNYIKLVW